MAILGGFVTGGFVTGGFLAASFSFSSSSSVIGSSMDPPAAAASRYRWIHESGESALSQETTDEARAAIVDYLLDNIPPYDVPIAQTLGFPRPSSSWDDEAIPEPPEDYAAISRRALEGQGQGRGDGRGRIVSPAVPVGPSSPSKPKADGLSDGILNSTIHYSLLAKDTYPWTDIVPRSIYMEYVVPYAVVNEPRVDHRPLLFDKLRDPLRKYERSPQDDAKKTKASNIADMKGAVKLINTHLWSLLGKRDRGGYSQPIIFQAGETPRIYDPLSVVAYGHSSCTGLAVLLIAALRAVGIPARMAGTPAWHGNEDEGNHSWVEVYVPSPDDGGEGEWIFLEPSPGIKESDTETANSDDLDRDPRARWFCIPERMDGTTKVYATRFARSIASTHYPMAWSDPETDVGVPGEDRTAYYTSVCGGSTPPSLV